MGTSKGYSAPPNWGGLKGKVTHETKEDVSPDKAKELIRQLIVKKQQTHQTTGINSSGGDSERSSQGSSRRQKGRSSGGNGQRGSSGVKAAGKFAGFASGVAQNGLSSELKKSGFGDLSDAPISEITTKLVDYFCESGSTFEQSDARNAMSFMIDELLEDSNSYVDVETTLVETANPEKMKGFMLKYFSMLIFEEFMRTFYEQVLHKNGNSKASNMEQQIKNYIISTAKNYTLDVDIDSIDWQGNDGRKMCEKIKKQTLEIFGE